MSLRYFAALSLVVVMMSLLMAPRALAGLYDDDTKAVTTGDINDQDYWWSKFDMMMLDLAIKQHQPEGKIGLELASTIRRLEELVKKYPKHEQLKAWLKHANEVNSKIDPNAPRGVSFNPGCPWDEANFGQLWVNLQWAQMKYDANQNDEAYGLMQNVQQNLEILLKPDRLKNYPDDLRKWVEDAKPKADTLMAKIKERK
jgi:hypothetical protein